MRCIQTAVNTGIIENSKGQIFYNIHQTCRQPGFKSRSNTPEGVTSSIPSVKKSIQPHISTKHRKQDSHNFRAKALDDRQTRSHRFASARALV